ncbi:MULTISPECIES: D-2-hydroxyacid dehydrogenase [Micrococcaceae]|uniref:D-2-hydroxyacid dehydrogenase n=1 Tax=Micrococcaceae TaxID=1268 RepID=UPI00027DFCA3|nr:MULTISPECIES: D-2-hydroxyacid dehydrogenase [Micrococcaceae]AFR28721.1 D-isomer specific 2-hydroxyacid dehydrogenase NAD-binding protein [Arthrobacter sp. Rue61a]MBP2266213.1 phosphoglycerate dehydrogenase-like enzyme [Pseudarthrobacter sp. PvP004]
MSQPKVIAIVQEGRPLPPLERLKADADIVVVRTADEYRKAQPGAEILFLNDFRTKLLREVGPGELRWIHTSSIGVDSLMTDDIINSDIVVSNSRGVCERPIAEWVLGVLLMFTKDLRRTIELQQARTWQHRETEPLLGRKVLVVGPGPVGRETVLLLRAAGMDVTVVGRSGRNDPQLGTISGFDGLEELLSQADDVVLTLPLTEETRGLFNSAMFRTMKPGARLVNVGRGAVVVEQDLLDSLDAGHLGAAALDVFEYEPLDAGNPLWGRRDILVSPHASGDLIGWRGRVVDCFARNLSLWKAHEPLNDVVDLKKLGTVSPAAGV